MPIFKLIKKQNQNQIVETGLFGCGIGSRTLTRRQPIQAVSWGVPNGHPDQETTNFPYSLLVKWFCLPCNSLPARSHSLKVHLCFLFYKNVYTGTPWLQHKLYNDIIIDIGHPSLLAHAALLFKSSQLFCTRGTPWLPRTMLVNMTITGGLSLLSCFNVKCKIATN